MTKILLNLPIVAQNPIWHYLPGKSCKAHTGLNITFSVHRNIPAKVKIRRTPGKLPQNDVLKILEKQERLSLQFSLREAPIALKILVPKAYLFQLFYTTTLFCQVI